MFQKLLRARKGAGPDVREQGFADPAPFFAALKPGLTRRLSTDQVEGMEFLLGRMRAAGWGVAWTAYGLATAWHETAGRMQPVREGLDASEAWRRKHLRYYPWYGRGYPQTTWRDNYRRADEKLGLGGSLIADPDRMLEPDIAAATMVRGMEEGWFTGRKLGDVLPRSGPARLDQFVASRAIINGTDRAAKIAAEAMIFQAALIAGGWRG